MGGLHKGWVDDSITGYTASDNWPSVCRLSDDWEKRKSRNFVRLLHSEDDNDDAPMINHKWVGKDLLLSVTCRGRICDVPPIYALCCKLGKGKRVEANQKKKGQSNQSRGNMVSASVIKTI